MILVDIRTGVQYKSGATFILQGSQMNNCPEWKYHVTQG